MAAPNETGGIDPALFFDTMPVGPRADLIARQQAPRTAGPRRAADCLIQATQCESDALRREAAADKFAAKGDGENAAWMLGIAKQERAQAEALRDEAAEIDADTMLAAAE